MGFLIVALWGRVSPDILSFSLLNKGLGDGNYFQVKIWNMLFPTPSYPSIVQFFYAYLDWSQEWSWELAKNLKSDNYLKMFIPANCKKLSRHRKMAHLKLWIVLFNKQQTMANNIFYDRKEGQWWRPKTFKILLD